MIRGLNLPGTPRATSACRGIPLLYFTLHYMLIISYSACSCAGLCLSKRKRSRSQWPHGIKRGCRAACSLGLRVRIPRGAWMSLWDWYVERKKNQLDATRWFIELIIRSTCFGHYCVHHQELDTIQMVTACGTRHFVCGWSFVWSGTVGYVSEWTHNLQFVIGLLISGCLLKYHFSCCIFLFNFYYDRLFVL